MARSKGFKVIAASAQALKSIPAEAMVPYEGSEKPELFIILIFKVFSFRLYNKAFTMFLTIYFLIIRINSFFSE